MNDPKKKKPRDLNLMAKSIIDEATNETQSSEDQTQYQGKNPAAVELGRLGGLKGGRARAEKLSAKRRKDIAIKAARSRWDKRRKI